MKLGWVSPHGIVPVEFADTYEVQRVHWWHRRIVIAAAENACGVISDLLLDVWPGPYWLMYVLIDGRTDREPGRYRAAAPLPAEEVAAFLRRHRAFLEGDSRHTLWLGPTNSRDRIVYDAHGLVYVYGRLRRVDRWLIRRGFSRGPAEVPQPHAHIYNPEFDDAEIDIVTGRFWHYRPLEDDD